MNIIELAKEAGLLDAQLGSWDYANRLQMFAFLVTMASIPKYPSLMQLFAEYHKEFLNHD